MKNYENKIVVTIIINRDNKRFKNVILIFIFVILIFNIEFIILI